LGEEGAEISVLVPTTFVFRIGVCGYKYIHGYPWIYPWLYTENLWIWIWIMDGKFHINGKPGYFCLILWYSCI